MYSTPTAPLGLPSMPRNICHRSFSVTSANGTRVSLLNEDTPQYLSCRLSIPGLTPDQSPLLRSCSNSPVPFPPLNFLADACHMASSCAKPLHQQPQKVLNPMPLVLPPCTRIIPRTITVRKYKCSYPGCGKAFTTSGHLSRHHRIHTGEKNFVCLHPSCNSRFSRQDNMMQHYRTHLSPGSRRPRSTHAHHPF
ncbi:transcriptional repressor [Linderina pennispora]|nr:transcriptional repressor [Linderina pennispora]